MVRQCEYYGDGEAVCSVKVNITEVEEYEFAVLHRKPLMHTHSLRVAGPLQRGAKLTRTTDILDIDVYVLLLLYIHLRPTKDFYPILHLDSPVLSVVPQSICIWVRLSSASLAHCIRASSSGEHSCRIFTAKTS